MVDRRLEHRALAAEPAQPRVVVGVHADRRRAFGDLVLDRRAAASRCVVSRTVLLRHDAAGYSRSRGRCVVPPLSISTRLPLEPGCGSAMRTSIVLVRPSAAIGCSELRGRTVPLELRPRRRNPRPPMSSEQHAARTRPRQHSRRAAHVVAPTSSASPVGDLTSAQSGCQFFDVSARPPTCRRATFGAGRAASS